MTVRAVLAAGLVAVALPLSGCGTTCDATADRLAALRRGMSVAEASRAMGCPGQPVAPASTGEGVASFVWQGPGTVVMETQLDFQDDRLLWYVTRARGAL